MNVNERNLTAVVSKVSLQERAARTGHTGAVVWLTGLSASGKSTIAISAERRLFDKGTQVFVLDGDNIRSGLNSDLGFSDSDRTENIRRIGEVAALFAKAGVVVIAAFISPFQSDRDRARMAAGDIPFFEVFLSADLDTCEMRDPKGLYRMAREGKLRQFTGIDSPYEAPQSPDLILNTALNCSEECVEDLCFFLHERILAGDTSWRRKKE